MPDEVTPQADGVDLSPLHRELDALKRQLCRCQHEGTCIACRGFEVLRDQSQMVVAAATQPVLMQVAQEAAMNDLMSRMGTLQQTLTSKIEGDDELQGLMARLFERLQDDLGGPEAMDQLMKQFGFAGHDMPGATPGPVPYDDRPAPPPKPPAPPESDAGERSE